MNNIFDDKYQRWNQYQVYGFNLLGGVVFSFWRKVERTKYKFEFHFPMNNDPLIKVHDLCPMPDQRKNQWSSGG